MAEYIEREEVLKLLGRNSITKHITFADDVSIYDTIKNLPAADVVKVKYGEWKQSPYCRRIYYCSICGRHIEDCTSNYKENFPYCHCGAKMDAERRIDND